MRRWILVVVVSLVAAAVGPRVVGARGRAGGEPFTYEPPEGFVAGRDPKAEQEGARVWVYADKTEGTPFAERKASVTRIVLTHSSKEMSVEEVELAKLAEEMPKAFEGLCTWKYRRHEMRVRADGARVGLVEGDCERDVDLRALGLPATALASRKLQLMFPDDTGTSIVTASYPTDEATRWVPLFEATIARARGVALRVPPPPPWQHFAWGAAGALLAWLGTALVSRPPKEKKSEA